MGLDSKLARFAVHRNHFQSGKVSPKLFRPTNKLRIVSTSRIDGKDYEGIKEEGMRVAKTRQDVKRLYGWAEITTKEVCGVGLKVHDDDDPLGHSSIVGWPEEEVASLPYQQQLAELANGIKLPEPIPVSG